MLIKNHNRKIAYTAALTAIAFVSVMCVRFLPLSFFPLIVAALVLYYNFAKCGVFWGLLHAASVSLFGFFVLFPDFLAYSLIAAPYTLIVFFLDKLKIKNKVVGFVIRYSLLLVFFNISLRTIFIIASKPIFDIDVLVDLLGGNYFIFAAVMSVLFIMCDISFGFIYGQLVRRKIFR